MEFEYILLFIQLSNCFW